MDDRVARLEGIVSELMCSEMTRMSDEFKCDFEHPSSFSFTVNVSEHVLDAMTPAVPRVDDNDYSPGALGFAASAAAYKMRLKQETERAAAVAAARQAAVDKIAHAILGERRHSTDIVSECHVVNPLRGGCGAMATVAGSFADAMSDLDKMRFYKIVVADAERRFRGW